MDKVFLIGKLRRGSMMDVFKFKNEIIEMLGKSKLVSKLKKMDGMNFYAHRDEIIKELEGSPSINEEGE